MFGLQEPDPPTALREPVSRMQLVFDEEDEGGREAPTDQNTALLHSSWELGQNSALSRAPAPSASSLVLTLTCPFVFGQMMTWTSSWASYPRTPTASDPPPEADPLCLEAASTASRCPRCSGLEERE